MAVTIVEGVALPPSLCPERDSCGLDFWMSPLASAWVGGSLSAVALTVSVEEGDRCAATLLWRRRLIPGVVLASGYPYSTVLGDINLFWERFGDVQAQLRRLGVARVEMGLSGNHIRRCLTTAGFGYVHKEYLDQLRAVRHVIDFGSFPSVAELEASYPSSLRWSIRKAAQEGVDVSAVRINRIGIAQALYEETMREKGVPAYYGEQRFGLIVQQEERPAIGRVYLARIGSSPVGMAAVIDAKASRHLIQLAVPRPHQKSRASDLLVAMAIGEAFSAGKRYFDFMATSQDDEGLSKFKAKWGGMAEDIQYAVIPVRQLQSKVVDYLRYTSRVWAARHARRHAYGWNIE